MKRKTLVAALAAALIFTRSLFAQTYDVYVSDAGNFNQPPWQILKFDQNGQNGSVFIKNNLAWPQDIFFLEKDNIVLVSNLNTGTIAKFDANTGVFLGNFAGGLGGPTRIKLGPDSLLYVLQWTGNGKVRRYKTDGTSLGDFTAVGVSNSIGLDWDSAGNLYVSSYNGKCVRKFSPSGADLGKVINAHLEGPTNLWFDDKGDLFITDYNAGDVKRFDAAGVFKGVFISDLPQGEGLDFTPEGNILIGCGETSSVRVYDPSGSLIKDLVPPKTAGLLTPNAVVIRPKKTSAVREIFHDAVFATPNAGRIFYLSNPDPKGEALQADIFNAAGALIKTLNFPADTVLDAAALPRGMYYIMARLSDGTKMRQEISIQ